MNTGPQTREVIKKSYDFALNHVGQDKDSGSIWEEYIQFLKDGTVGVVSSTLRAFSHELTLLACDNMGGTAEDGPAAKGLPQSCADSVDQCRASLDRA
jgi:hypothetical protein